MKAKALRIGTILHGLRHGEGGGTLVETALTLPLLVTLITGAVELSRVAYTSLEVVSAAKAGVSYGALTGGTSSDTAGITYVAQNDAPNVSTLTVTSVASSYACSDGTAAPGPSYNSDCLNSHIEQTLTVQTQATIDPLIHLPGLPTTYTITGQASQVCLQ